MAGQDRAPRVRRRRVVSVVLMLALVAGIAIAVRTMLNVVTTQPGCVVTAQGRSVTLDPVQAGNAATIAAVGTSRSLPQRAVVIALATAMQESKLRDLTSGDRDSLGLFQQRPSQGWGTPTEILNPVYASGMFYSALVKVPNYTSLPLTVAAQDVQHSGEPDAYAPHEQDATVLAAALTGTEPAALTCRPGNTSLTAETRSSNGLTPRANAVRAALATDFRTAPASAYTKDGTGFDVTGLSTAGQWAVAQWAVAQAQTLDIQQVVCDGKVWSRDDPTHWNAWQGTAYQGRVHIQVVSGS